jgi:hypothetical protein
MTSTKTPTVKYDVAVTRGRKIVATEAKTSWSLGDLGNQVEVKYAENNLGQFADDIGIKLATLRNYCTIARKYPKDQRSLNSFEVHAIFSAFDNRVELVQSQIWTVTEARAKRDELNGIVPDSDDDSDGAGAGDSSQDDERTAYDKALANVARLEGELQAARAKVAKMETDNPALKAPAAPAVVMHSVRGIPQHAAGDNVASCPKCKPAITVAPVTERAGSPRRSRKAAA